MAQIGVQLSTIKPSTGRNYDPLPKDNYPAIVSGSELKSTKAGDGKYLSMEFTVIDGEYNGRKVWENMNIENSDPKVAARALSDLAALAAACNVVDPQDTSELHDIPFTLSLSVKKKKDGAPGEMEQRVDAYIAMGSAPPARVAAPAASGFVVPAAQVAARPAAPWAAK